VFSEPAAQLLDHPDIDSVIVTDTLPLSESQRFERLTVLPIAPLIARAIHEVFDDGSVTSMFDGAA
jgi:ribose-phosphate pyrophosphokinase